MPVRWLGVNDDLTDPERVDEDGVSYVPEFSGVVPYFNAANAVDPRAGIVHEGAHYQQLSMSFRHPRPLRRHYYDSGANEGIAYYNEELMLASGLFDDQPVCRTIMYNFMRLRALRVEVDVRLAIGRARHPCAAELSGEGRADGCGYRARGGVFLRRISGSGDDLSDRQDPDPADVRRRRARAGRDFVVRDFHDRLWREGNVPISLQRWEFLDDDSDLLRIGTLARANSGAPS